MPILSLTGDRAKDAWSIFTTMMYPRTADEERRQALVDKGRMGLEGDPTGGDLQAQLSSLVLEYAAKDLGGERRALPGSIAGNVLVVIWQITQHRPDLSASVGRAAHVIEQENRKTRPKTLSGSQVSRDADNLRKAWTSHRTVAAWWAAFFVFDEIEAAQIPLEKLFDRLVPRLERFMAMAERFTDFAESHRPQKGGASLLQPGEAWRVPSEIELPDLTLPVSSLWMEAAWDTYNSRRR